MRPFSFCLDSDNESKDGSTTQEKKHGRVSQPINTIAYTVSAFVCIVNALIERILSSNILGDALTLQQAIEYRDKMIKCQGE